MKSGLAGTASVIFADLQTSDWKSAKPANLAINKEI
jgi:hypothetical protein